MKKLNRTLRNIYYSKYFSFIILVILMSIAHLAINLNYGDDITFSKVMEKNNLFQWIPLRYETWSSRLVIESVMVVILQKNAFLWRIIDVTMIILLVMSISEIFVKENIKQNNWIIAAFILLYPFQDMSTSGWGTATINYLWPLALGMYSLIIVKKILEKEKIKWYEYILSTLALIYAISIEQMCGILLGTYGILTLYLIVKEKKVKIYMLFQTFICLSDVVFILTCPGNSIRKVRETSRYFSDFNNLSFLKKLELGFSSTMAKFFFEPNIVFIVFSMLLLTLVFIKTENIGKRIISIVPFLSTIMLGLIGFIISKISPNTPNIVNSMTRYGIINLQNYYVFSSYIPLILLIIIEIFILASVYFSFGKTKKTLLLLFILLIGLSSRIVVGFSPTIWASNDRTFIFMYFSIIIVGIIIYNEIYLSNYKRIKYINNIILILSALSFIKFIAYIFILEIFRNKENLMQFIGGILHHLKR